VGVVAALHQTAEGRASVALAVAGSHSVEPLVPALLELGEVVGNLLVLSTTRSSCHLKT
jgi:H+/gluconate symporter-like permease